MTIKRGLQPPAAMLNVLTAVNRVSTTEAAKALKISTDRASELVHVLQEHGLVVVENHPVGGRGRPKRVATLTDRGRRILELLRGRPGKIELRECDFRLLLRQTLGRCKRCRSTRPLSPACLTVASYAHLLGMDWEHGVPVCSCQRWPKRTKSWAELVGGRT